MTSDTRLSASTRRSYSSHSSDRRRVVALKTSRLALRNTSLSEFPDQLISAVPSITTYPDHQSAAEMRIEHCGSLRRFLNLARSSVIETPTPRSCGRTVTILIWALPFRRYVVSTPCGLSEMNWVNFGSNSIDPLTNNVSLIRSSGDRRPVQFHSNRWSADDNTGSMRDGHGVRPGTA